MSSNALADFEEVTHNEDVAPGRLRFTGGGVGWKSSDDKAEVVLINKSQIRGASWTRVARGFQLRINLERERHDFQQLKRDDLDTLRRILEQNGVKLDVRDPSVRGWNWGKAEIGQTDLTFMVQQKVAFEIPTSYISNSNMAGKNEVSLEVIPSSSSSVLPPGQTRPMDELMELRLYIPGRSIKRKDSDAGSDEDMDDEEEPEGEVDEEGNEISAAQSFYDRVKKAARVGDTAGEEIVSFLEVLVVTPRGRYEIEMHADHLRLRGKTYDYKVTYKSIQKMFLLPKLDQNHWLLVVALEPPLRQGQTKYPFLVMQFPSEEEVDVTLNMDEDEIQAKYGGQLKKSYEDLTYKVMSTLFKNLVGKELVQPGKYTSKANAPGIKCNVKAVQGELYFLDKGLIFIAKSPINVDYTRISKATFSRITGAMRTCDITIKLNDDSTEHTFTAINKDELENIKRHFKTHAVRVKEAVDDSMRDPTKMMLGDDDDDLSDDDDDDEDGKPAAKKSKGDDDDSEEEDEDFEADSSDDGSPSEDSDDSDDASDASDPMVKEIQKKEAKTAGKEKAKAAPAAKNGKEKKSKEEVDSDEDDAMDVDDEEEEEAEKEPPKKKQKTT